jgi:NTE family protein
VSSERAETALQAKTARPAEQPGRRERRVGDGAASPNDDVTSLDGHRAPIRPGGSATRPRRGLVLGAGGVLGAAWTTGALCALAEVEGFDPRTAEVIVGTSAGSVLAALLTIGVSAADLLDHQRGLRVEGWELDYNHDTGAGGALPARPKLGIGSRALLWRTARHPRRVTPMAAMSAVLPLGTGSLEPVRRLIDSLTIAVASTPLPEAWIVAMDYDTGKRVAFGRPGAPEAALPDAVAASCAIPGWYAPVVIGDRRYVDGGACSSTSVDLLAGLGLDEVFVLAPMAAFVLDHPSTLIERMERRLRSRVTRRMEREAERVRASGCDVTMMTPGPEDLAVMGANVMDPARRQNVLDTSLRTSAAALRETAPDDLATAG